VIDWFSFLKAILFGIVEGATEFIPVSSTGHLILVQNWLGFTGEKANAFIIFIQLGAVFAVLWLYRIKFITIVRTMFHEPQSRNLVFNLVAGTIPAVLIGLPTENWIEAHLFKPLPVALALVVGGVLILWIEKRNQREPSIMTVDQIPLRTSLGIGCVQVLSILFPGLSRSATTIMGGLGFGLSRVAATEFSFFLAIPALFGASLVKLYGARDLLSITDLAIFLTGFLVSFGVALVVIRMLLAYVSRRSFIPFAWYRIGFGVLLIIYYSNNLTGF
jgi:undecaprenyl-diphosphatase